MGMRCGAAACLALLLVTATARASLESEVVDILHGASLGDTKVSVIVLDLRTGKPLVEVDPDQPMIPASNMKLITTAAALSRLGPDFKFETSLYQVPVGMAIPGQPDAVMNDPEDEAPDTPPGPSNLPSLLVRASGDPAFGDPAILSQAGYELADFINLWVTAVQETGQTHFHQLIIDDRVFDLEFVHPEWPTDQLHRYYCAQVAGLNFYENVLAVLPVPGINPGDTPVIQLEPYFPALRTVNRAKTGDTDLFDIQRRPGTNRFTFNGSVRNRRNAPFRVTVHDPPLFFAQYFKYQLKQAGITVDHVARLDHEARLDLKALTPLHQLNTTLAGVLDRTNQDSQNMFAEALFKRLGHELTGAPGSFNSGAAAVRLFLRDALSRQVGLAAFRVSDGSGMSRNNRVTARILVTLLEYMYRDPVLRPIYSASLAHAGHTGTLRKRLRDMDGQVYGKSGYLGASAGYASSLSGYLITPNGRAYAFSMLFNGFMPPKLSNARMKAVQDQILTHLNESLSAADVR